jgi:hypothetical protein
MSKKQKDTVLGQLLPWNAVLDILNTRAQTKVPKPLHARSRQLIEEMADHEFKQVVAGYIYE